MRRPRPHPSHRAGFSLLETVIGISVVMIGMMAMTSTSLVVHSLEESDKARRLATNALQGAIEQVNADSNAAHDADVGWAPSLVATYAPGAVPGNAFDVAGLDPWPGIEQVGSIWVVTDETLTDDELGVELGMPRDLDGDGAVANDDVSGAATLLPVVVRLRWDGEAGQRELVHGFYLLGY